MSDHETQRKELSPERQAELLEALKARFENNMVRHVGLEWAEVQARLEADPEALWSLGEMERTGGEPDVVGRAGKTGEYVFYDCSAAPSSPTAGTTPFSCTTTARPRTTQRGGSAAR